MLPSKVKEAKIFIQYTKILLCYNSIIINICKLYFTNERLNGHKNIKCIFLHKILAHTGFWSARNCPK